MTSTNLPGGRPDRPSATRALIGTAIVALVALAIGWAIISFASSNPDKVNIGKDVFAAGKAERLRKTITAGGPILYPDLLGRGRPIYVQTSGDEWLAFEAVAPGASEECALSWDGTAREFHEPDECGGLTFPANGKGLVQYSARENPDGTVEVDLRQPL